MSKHRHSYCAGCGITLGASRNLPVLAEVARGLSITDRLAAFSRGVIALRDIIFFASFIGVWLFANAIAVDLRKAD